MVSKDVHKKKLFSDPVIIDLLSYILLPMVSKDVHNIAYFA